MGIVQESVAHAADNGAGLVFFLRTDGFHVVGGYNVLVKALGLDTNLVFIGLGSHSDDIKADGGGKHAAVVMVGMVAGNLASAGNREQTNLGIFGKGRAIQLLKAVDSGKIADLYVKKVGVRAVKRTESGIVFAVLNGLFQGFGYHVKSLLYWCRDFLSKKARKAL